MVGLSVKAVVSAVPVAAVYVMAYLFLSSLSGAVTGLLLEKLTNAVLLKEQVYIVYIVVYVSFCVLLQLAGFAYAIAMNTFVFEKVSDELNRRLADAMVRIEYFDLEKKEKLDAIYRARECIEDERIPGCFMQAVMLAGTIVALVSSFFVAGSWNMMIPVILVLFFLPEMLIRKKSGESGTDGKRENRDAGAGKKRICGHHFFEKRRQRKSRCSRPAIGSLSSGGKRACTCFFGNGASKKTAIDRLMWAQLFRVAGLLACFDCSRAACLEQKILAGALAGALSLLPAIQEALSELGERSWNLQKSLPYTECYFNITGSSRKKKECGADTQ